MLSIMKDAVGSAKQEILPSHELFASKTSYPTEAYGTVVMVVNIPNRPSEMKLNNVALVTGCMTNLVSLKPLNQQHVHWDSEVPGRL